MDLGIQLTVTASQLAGKRSQDNLVILNIRLKEDFENLSEWSNSIPQNSEVVVYCVAGKWVSQKVAHISSEKEMNVSVLAGGIEAWKNSSD